MRLPRSLQARLALSLGVLLTLLWIAAASVTAVILRHEMDEVFDSALQETAQRLLPLAVVDIVGREEDGVTQRLAAIREHDEFFTYIVRDAKGRILLQSHAADPAVFPPWDGPGFRQTATHRLYNDEALQGTSGSPWPSRWSTARQSPAKSRWAWDCRSPRDSRSPSLRDRPRGAGEPRAPAPLPGQARGARCTGSVARAGRGSSFRDRTDGGDPEQPSGPAEGGLRRRAQLCRQCRARAANAACRGHRAGPASAVGDPRPRSGRRGPPISRRRSSG